MTTNILNYTTTIPQEMLDQYDFWPGSIPQLTPTTSDSEPQSEAIKYDNNKTDWSLMPWEAIEDIVKVLEFGAKKYSRWNWTEGSGFSYTRIVSSLLRHTFAWVRGEDKDPESGLSHLAHMGCNIVFLLYYNRYKDRYNNDDRKTVNTV